MAHGSGCCRVRALIHTPPPSHTCQPPCQVIMSFLHSIAGCLSSQLAPRVPPRCALACDDFFFTPRVCGSRLRPFHISLSATYSASEWPMHCYPPPRHTHTQFGKCVCVTVSNQLETKSTVALHDCGLLN